MAEVESTHCRIAARMLLADDDCCPFYWLWHMLVFRSQQSCTVLLLVLYCVANCGVCIYVPLEIQNVCAYSQQDARGGQHSDWTGMRRVKSTTKKRELDEIVYFYLRFPSTYIKHEIRVLSCIDTAKKKFFFTFNWLFWYIWTEHTLHIDEVLDAVTVVV